MKTCSKCKAEKPTSEFHKDRREKGGLRGYCKSCACERSRKWYKTNSKKVCDSVREYRGANPEKVREHSRKWKKANPEKVREISQKWAKANPEKKREHARRRRARKAGAAGTHTAEQAQARVDYYGGKCRYCGCAPDTIHLDHRIPLARGGSDHASNLVPSCPSCNSRKGTKSEKEFLDSRRTCAIV